MNKCAILISGGSIDRQFVLSVLDREKELSILKKEKNDWVIGVDRGVKFLYEEGIRPDYVVGDFDSLPDEIVLYCRETNVPVRAYNPVKDATDTEIAIRLAITLGCKKLIILGATGGRLDHLWANVQSLYIPLKAGVEAEILDLHNRIRLINEKTHLPRKEAFGRYFSIFPLGETIFDVTITGAKYPLRNHTLTPTDSLCVSNEISADEVVIDFAGGTMILMETRD